MAEPCAASGDRVHHGGRIVEVGDVVPMMKAPLHPYTHALLGTLPRVDGLREHLAAIPGNPPELTAPNEHCPFLPRCTKAMNICRTDPAPPLVTDDVRTHPVACYNPVWQTTD